MSDRETNLMSAMTQTTWRCYLWVGFLSIVILWGFYAYIHEWQVRQGSGGTGTDDQVVWGLYIVNFVFFIAISIAGTLISAILRLVGARWRHPIVRLAEAITVVSLAVASAMLFADLLQGRPERLLYLVRYARIQSPITWDFLAVSTYLLASLIYFYLPLIPDLALAAARFELPTWRRKLYRFLSLGWVGTAEEKRLLEGSIFIMTLVVLPLAVAVHTILAWVFSMTLRPGWLSTVFGPYFVVGAIYAGCATVILLMYILRRSFHLESYLENVHFRNSGFLLLTFCALYLYINITEYFTFGYIRQGAERQLLDRLFFGEEAPYFWSMQVLGVLVPLILLAAVLGLKRYRQFTIPGVVMASGLVIAGGWVSRFLIVVPPLETFYLPARFDYRPTWVEWSVTAAGFAGFALLYTLIAKLFPMVSIWETRTEAGAAASAAVPVAEGLAGGARFRSALGGLVLTLLLLSGLPAQAATETPKLQKSVLSGTWQALPTATVSPTPDGTITTTPPLAVSTTPAKQSRAANWLRGLVRFWEGPQKEERRRDAVEITASLQDPNGTPLAFRIVKFSLKTTFGNLEYGGRPTLADGKAKLTIREPRYGIYPVDVIFAGDARYEASTFAIPVDFGPRPSQTLPAAGSFITPYPTPGITISFLFFFGLPLLVICYAFGYRILWCLRRVSKEAGKVNVGPAIPSGLS